MVETRYDASLGRVQRTPTGGLRIDAYPTREGVFSYRQADGSERLEYRPASEVYAADSLSTLRAAPVTDLHPKDPVTAENWKQLAVGHMSEDVRAQPPYVAASAYVQDANVIKAIGNDTRRELSCGYTCDLDPTPGVWQGRRYDGVQRNIRYNHVAIGPPGWGRAGPSVALRLDEGDHEEPRMKMIRIDNQDYEIGSEAHLAKLDSIKTIEIKAVTDRADKAEALAKAEKTRADAAEAKIPPPVNPPTMAEAVKARVSLITDARDLLGDRFDADVAENMSDDDVKIEVMKVLDPDFDPKGRSSDFISGAMLTAVRLLKAGNAQTATLDEDGQEPAPSDEATPGPGTHPAQPRAMGGRGDGEYPEPSPLPRRRMVPGRQDSKGEPSAEERMRKDSQEAWKKPLQMSRKEPS